MTSENLFAAVIGDPIDHSLSPDLFKLYCEATGRSLIYRKLHITSDKLKTEIELLDKKNWAGWNVTLPHKIEIKKYCTRLDATAEAAGAVNVIRFTEDESVGYNTDVEGFLAPLKARSFEIKGCRTLVLGAGGAARAVCLALKNEGAGEIIVLNRTIERAKTLAESCGGRWGGLEAADRETENADLVVNATSLGVSPVNKGVRFKKGALAYDLVYRPARTEFLKAAEIAGVEGLGGMSMLAAQAAATWKIWFGETLEKGLVADSAKTLEETL